MERLQRSFRRSRASADMQKLYSTIEEISKLLEELESTIESVKRKQNDILGMPKFPNDSRPQELAELHGKVASLSIKTRSKLQSFSRGMKESETSSYTISKEQELDFNSGPVIPLQSKSPKPKHTPALHRIRNTQYSVLLRRYIDIIAEYHSAQIDHRDRVRRRLMNQMDIMNVSCTEDELDGMIQAGSYTAFTHSIIMDTQIARRNLEDISERHNEFIKLEKSIRELNDLFQELAVLVELQREQVNNIAINVMATADYVAAGTVNLKKAEIWKKRTRKMKAYLYTLGSSAAAVTVIGVIVICLV